jgi:tetratricopeptide (TPR) repeat protein
VPALALAWIYDITSDGSGARQPQSSSRRPQLRGRLWQCCRSGTLAEALNARACIAALADFDFAAAAHDFERAIQGNPQYATAHQWQAMHLFAPLARFDEARAALECAHDIDPLSPAISAGAGVLAYYARDYEGALARCAETLTAAPDFGFAWYVTGLARLALGDPAGALTSLQRALALSPASAETCAALAVAEAAHGDRASTATRLTALEERSLSDWVSPVLLAQVDVALGEHARAIDRLELARQLRAPDLIWAGVRPTLDALRGEPAMVALLERLGLPNSGCTPRPAHAASA